MHRTSFRRTGSLTLLALVLSALASTISFAQQVPDAPTPQKPKFPANTKPAAAPASGTSSSATTDNTPTDQSPPPSSVITDMPRGKSAGDPNAEDSGRESFSKEETIRVNVMQVVIPVTIKDHDGKLVDGLLKRDFSVFEDDEPKTINLFTSDPFPLSAAVILDLGMSDTAMKNVKATLPSLGAAFSPYDEVSLYTYGNTIEKVNDFTAINEEFNAGIHRMTANRSGRTGGAPVMDGPFASGPSVNGKPVIGGPGASPNNTPNREYRTLNDAVQRAANDLATRPKGRRRIIFLISDGTELGSKNSFSDVRKTLLSNGIIVYAVGVDSAAIPVYDRIAQSRLPGQGYGNILPRYVSATGGEMFAELTRSNIEKAFAQVTEVARNQYTIGYVTKLTTSTSYRNIEVRVKRLGLKVYTKDGYYPLPPQKQNSGGGSQ